MLGNRALTAALAGLLLLASCGGDSGASVLERAAVEEPLTTSPTTPPTTPSTAATSSSAAPTATTTTPAPVASPPPAVAAAPAAGSPDELAARVVAAETAVRDADTPTTELAARAFELQQLYRQLARTPEWDGAVLAAVPPKLHGAVTNNIAARREFRAMHSKLSDTLPPWRIVDPVPADELVSYYREAEATFGVPWEILAAVNLVETGMGRIRGTSVAGAQGPMQFMPATWEAFGAGGDVNDTRDAIVGAARYLAHNGGGSGNIDGALWNYNHSNRYVRGVKHYAAVMTENPRTFHGFYHWQVIYLSTSGDIWMPTGYEATARIPVVDHIAAHPHVHLGTATD